MKSKKQSAITLIESFIIGLFMWFVPQDSLWFKIFATYKLVIGGFGVLLLIVIGFLSADDK